MTPSLTVPPTPHRDFKFLAMCFSSEVLPPNPFISVTADPLRPLVVFDIRITPSELSESVICGHLHLRKTLPHLVQLLLPWVE